MKSTLNQPVVCVDGFRMSVQANRAAYCTPRMDKASYYESVEVGFPSEMEPLLMQYAEEPERPTGSVYAYVPATVVTLIIAKHGGMVSGDVPPGVTPLKPIEEKQ